jgi:cytosine/adenosine deaminase-related metal-dependent hydrolase
VVVPRLLWALVRGVFKAATPESEIRFQAVPTLLKSATLVDLEPASIEVADLRVAGGTITARGALAAAPDDEVIDLNGRLVLPGFVSAHHRLTSTVLRGLLRHPAGALPDDRLRERVDAALTLDDVEAFAAVGGLEGLTTGTTCVFDSHASPAATTGSLTRVAHGLGGAGLRALLACEVGDLGGAQAREEALAECASYVERARGRYRGAFALAAFDTVSTEALTAVQAALGRSMLLASLAEHREEEERSAQLHGKTPTERLVEVGLVGTQVVLARNVHLSWPDLSRLISAGTWLALTSRANMATRIGQPAPGKFGVRGCFGTDTLSLDTLAEAQVASLRSRRRRPAHRHSARHRQRAAARVCRPFTRPSARCAKRRSPIWSCSTTSRRRRSRQTRWPLTCCTAWRRSTSSR